MPQITFTNLFYVDGKPTNFLELTEEERIEAGNWARRIPLETQGEIREIKTA